jgi:hypothetical protein
MMARRIGVVHDGEDRVSHVGGCGVEMDIYIVVDGRDASAVVNSILDFSKSRTCVSSLFPGEGGFCSERGVLPSSAVCDDCDFYKNGLLEGGR